MVEDGLNLLERLLFTDVLSDHLRWKIHQHLSVLHHLLHEAGTHHLTVIGDGVVEGKGRDRRYLCLITDAHPCQGRLTPVGPVLTCLVHLRHTDASR